MTTPLDSRVLAHLQRREAVHAASTPGVWSFTWDDDGFFYLIPVRIVKDGYPGETSEADMMAIAVSHNSTPADLAGIRALLGMYCFCVSNQDNLLCQRCAALTAWADAMDQQASSR